MAKMKRRLQHFKSHLLRIIKHNNSKMIYTCTYLPTKWPTNNAWVTGNNDRAAFAFCYFVDNCRALLNVKHFWKDYSTIKHSDKSELIFTIVAAVHSAKQRRVSCFLRSFHSPRPLPRNCFKPKPHALTWSASTHTLIETLACAAAAASAKINLYDTDEQKQRLRRKTFSLRSPYAVRECGRHRDTSDPTPSISMRTIAWLDDAWCSS